jgi:hypothetical protein
MRASRHGHIGTIREAKQVVREEPFVFFPQFLDGAAISIKAKTANSEAGTLVAWYQLVASRVPIKMEIRASWASKSWSWS